MRDLGICPGLNPKLRAPELPSTFLQFLTPVLFSPFFLSFLPWNPLFFPFYLCLSFNLPFLLSFYVTFSISISLFLYHWGILLHLTCALTCVFPTLYPSILPSSISPCNLKSTKHTCVSFSSFFPVSMCVFISISSSVFQFALYLCFSVLFCFWIHFIHDLSFLFPFYVYLTSCLLCLAVLVLFFFFVPPLPTSLSASYLAGLLVLSLSPPTSL